MTLLDAKDEAVSRIDDINELAACTLNDDERKSSQQLLSPKKKRPNHSRVRPSYYVSAINSW